MTDAVSLSVSEDDSVDESKFFVHGIAPKNVHRCDYIIRLCVCKQKGI